MKYFKTSDIALCSLLATYGYNVEFIDKVNSSKAEFSIKHDNRLDKLIQSYFAKKLLVEPMAYFNNLKLLKTRIYHA